MLFEPALLRQRLATRHGIHPAREPGQFPYVAEIVGLTPAGLGYDGFVAAFHRLRNEAAAQTNGDFTLSVIRDPGTHERRGYRVHTRQQQDADMIAARVLGIFK